MLHYNNRISSTHLTARFFLQFVKSNINILNTMYVALKWHRSLKVSRRNRNISRLQVISNTLPVTVMNNFRLTEIY